MMQRRSSLLVVVALVVVVTCCAFAEATLVANGTTNSQQTPSANDAASAMVNALAAAPGADSQVPPIPENHSYDRAQRIVARKGVSSEVAVARNGSSSTEDVVAAVVAPPPALLMKPTDVVANGTVRSATTTSSSSVSSTTRVAVVANNSSTIASSSTTRSHPVTQGSSPMPHNASHTPSNGVTVSNVTVMTTSSTSSSSSQSTTTTTTTTTSSTTSTPSTTTTTTRGTTAAPKKPKVVYSIEDEPRLVQAAKPGYSLPALAVPFDEPLDSSGRLRVDEPLVQLSKEYIAPGAGPNRRDYVLPIVTLIFVVPLLLGLFLLSYRRAKEFWLTRHYRRMDFLIDGMYNY